MKTNLSSFVRVFLLSFTAISAGALHAAPLVHEPFAYPAGNLHGASGSSEIGLLDAWDAKLEEGNSTSVVSSSLNGAGAATGGAIGSLAPGANSYGGSRAISAGALAANGLLNDGATLWLSMVMGYGPGANTTNAHLSVVLANNSFSPWDDYGIIDDEGQPGSGIGLFLGRSSHVNGRVLPVQFRNLAEDGGITGNTYGTWTESGTTLGENEFRLYVAKITWGASSGDPDSITVYQPDSAMNLGEPISFLSDIFVDQASFDTLTFARGDVVVLDEIRFGASYEDVTPPDTTAPALVKTTPTGSTGLLPPKAVFGEPIQAGSGHIRIFNTSGQTLPSTISISDTTQVSISGSTLTINPTVPFSSGENYSIEMDAGLVKDLAGNHFAGVSGPSAWTFEVSPVSFPDDDTDGDGLTNATEETLGTNPLLSDTDADGLTDGQEASLGTNPLVADSDGDGFSDSAEVQAGSNPLSPSSLPGDIDGDGLDDTWEITHFGDLTQDGSGDPDEDTLTNAVEFLLNLNPVNPDTDNDGNPDWMGIPGYLYVEQWNNLPGVTLNDLFESSAFYGQPDDTYLVSQAKSLTNVGDNYGLRMSGRVIAPVTGSYRFRVAGDDQCELFLSTDSSASKRRSIAKVTNWTYEEDWFAEPGQQSTGINLVAGQEYYMEVLMKEGGGSDHVAVAWEYPGQEIQIIPTTSLRSFIAEPGDADRDGMPDAWELQVGLNPADNGVTDINQSAYADIDGDGLLNYQEYQSGGNPFVFDAQIGVLELDKWFDIPQTDLQTFFKSAQYTQAADLRTWTGAEGPPQWQSFAARLRGTITAPETGIYTFWMSGDDEVELWLSSNESRFGKRRIAYCNFPTSAYQWLSTPTQQSTSFRLERGKSYFIEGLVKNYSHGGDFSIGWSRVPDSNWNTADIGIDPASWTVEGRNMTVSAAGGSISGTADSFAFRYFTLQGDGELVARMGDITAANNVARAGLMIRESLDAGSAHAMMLRTAEGRLMFQFRDTTGGEAQDSFTNVTGEPFQWLKLVRKGDSLAGYESMDGKTWRLRGYCSIPMNQTVFAGMAVAEVDAGGSVQTSWNE